MSADAAALGQSRFDLAQAQDRQVLKLSGAWRLSDGIASAESLFEAKERAVKPGHLEVDASSLTDWDSALICFLVDLRERCERSDVTLDLAGLPLGATRLVDLALAVPAREGAARSDRLPGFVETLGRDVLDSVKSAGEMLDFLGQSLIGLGRTVTGRARFRMSDVFLIFQQCGPNALPIVSLIAFLVGVILGFVGLVQLEQFGANIYVANLVGLALVRELGGMMTGIVMAGRTGAAFAAQLGTMNVNEEIAAYRTVGIDPVEFLILPRILALIVAVPLLTIYANIVGMLGGALVTAATSDISLLQFYNQAASAVDLVDWASGMFKAMVYGIIIAVAGCLRGMQCTKSAAAVGDAATSAVVTSIVFIIVAEAVLTVIYQVLGV